MTTEATPQSPAALWQRLQPLYTQFTATLGYLWRTQKHWLLWFGLPLAIILIYPLNWWLRLWFGKDSPLMYQAWVPAGALLLAYVRRENIYQTYEELQTLFPDKNHPKRHGNELLLLAGCVLMVLATAAKLIPLTVIAFLLIVTGTIYLIYGPFLLRALTVPLAYLLLMVPPPQSSLGVFTAIFQGISVSFAGQVLQTLGVKAQIRAPFILLPNQYALEVSGSYSGLGIVLPTLALVILLLLLRKPRPLVWMALLIFATAAGLVMNMVRVVLMGLIGSVNQQVAGWLHDAISWPFILLAFLVTLPVANRLQRRRFVEEG